MAFYFLGDGTTDVPVWFEDESNYASVLYASMAAALIASLDQDISQPNRLSVFPSLEQYQPPLEDAWISLPWLTSYHAASSEDAWTVIEDVITPSNTEASQTLENIAQTATFTGTTATLSLVSNQTLGDISQSATFTGSVAVSQPGGALGPSGKRYYRRYDVYDVEAGLVKVAESAQRSPSRKGRKQQLAKVQRSLGDFLSRVEPQSELPLSILDLRAAYDASMAQAAQDFAYAQWKDNVLRSVNQALIELRLQIEIIEEEDNDMLLMVL
jgi:hypothetical protein